MPDVSETDSQQRIKAASRPFMLAIRQLKEKMKKEYRLSEGEFRLILSNYFGQTGLDDALSKIDSGVDGLAQVARGTAKQD